jgi:transposase
VGDGGGQLALFFLQPGFRPGRHDRLAFYRFMPPVDTEHHLIVAHDVINVGNDRAQLADISNKAKAELEVEKLDVVADRGYFDSEEILACDRAGITVTLPKPLTSSAKAQGRFGKQDFRYLADEDVYMRPPEKRRLRPSA